MNDVTAGFDPEEQKIMAALPDQGEDSDITADVPAAAPAPAASTTAAPAPAPAAAPAPAPAAAAPAPAPAPAPANEDEAPKPAETVSRDALRAARHAERKALEDAETLRKQLEAKEQELIDARAGKPAAQTDMAASSYTDAELEEMREDFPQNYKIVMNQRRLESELAELRGKQTPAATAATEGFQPAIYEPKVQEIIDGNADLLAWQYDANAQDKFDLAVKYDSSLRHNPEWETKTASERFVEAVRLVKAAKGDTTATPKPNTDDIETRMPGGISDFRGGAPGHQASPVYDKMTDEQIIASMPNED